MTPSSTAHCAGSICAGIGKPGFAGADQFIGTLFGRFEAMFANVYVGLAERARDLAIERVKKKTSVAMSRSMAYHPEVQHAIAQIFIEVEGMIAGLIGSRTNGPRALITASFGQPNWSLPSIAALKAHSVWLISRWTCPVGVACSGAMN